MTAAVAWREGAGWRLAQADWLAAARDLERAQGRAWLDLVYADPPFHTGSIRVGRAGAFDDRSRGGLEGYLAWLRAQLEATIPLLRATGSVLLHLDWRTSHRARVLLDELLGPDCFVNHIVWSYGLGGSSARRFARKHDDILWYSVRPDAHWYDPPMVPARSARMAGRLKKATDVLDIPSINNMAAERTGYPTQKPLALLRVLINACCPAGGVVLDPCCGSGTALVAAVGSGRRAVGADVSPDAFRVALGRLEGAGVAGVGIGGSPLPEGRDGERGDLAGPAGKR